MKDFRGTFVTDIDRCPNCSVHREKHMARFGWIVGQPDTLRWDCEYCRRRDAIQDGSVQLALLQRMKKSARRNLKDLHLIIDQLSPAMKQEVAEGCDQAIGALNELVSTVTSKTIEG